jgi:hypothetical protein
MRTPLVPIALLVAALGVAPAARGERILFLDRCTGGCEYTPGFDDAGANVSSIVSGTSTLSAFSHGDESWAAVVACVRETFAPFAITVTEDDPGTVEHFEIAIGGTPQQLGLPMGVANVAPITCEGDRAVDDGIGFAFAQALGDVPLEICWNAAQAAGTLLGLDRELLAGDVMTYLTGSLPKAFLDETASCGEFAPRTCQCDGATTQNSYQHLLALLPEPGTGAAGAAGIAALASIARRRGRYRKIG